MTTTKYVDSFVSKLKLSLDANRWLVECIFHGLPSCLLSDSWVLADDIVTWEAGLESCSLQREIGAVTFCQRLPTPKHKPTIAAGFFTFSFCFRFGWLSFISYIYIYICVCVCVCIESSKSFVTSDRSHKAINASSTHNNYQRLTTCWGSVVRALDWCIFKTLSVIGKARCCCYRQKSEHHPLPQTKQSQRKKKKKSFYQSIQNSFYCHSFSCP